MTVFAVLMPVPQPALAERIVAEYPGEHLKITDTQWLISAAGTVVEVTTKLGMFDEKDPNKAPTGVAIIFATSSYYGRAPTPTWDWIKQRLEKPPRG
jgi:hypothetical protein